EGVPILPRGGATSQSGQTVGRALVLDFSKYLNRLVAGDQAAAGCVVEPGIVLDELNRQLKSTGLWFPVAVSTASRATIGRMGGEELVGQGLDRLRHHARQRAGDRCDPGGRQRGALRGGGA